MEQTGTVVIYKQTIKEATPLWCAAAVGHLGIVKLLVEYGANVNSKTSSKSIALRAACYDGHLNIAKFLVQHGADINALNHNQFNCLDLACWKGHYSLAEYLIQKGVDLNNKDSNGCTALHECAENGYTEIIDLLLKHGAKITTNNDNETPLMTAALRGMTATVEYFITKTDCARNDTIDALELLGTTFSLITKQQDMEKAYYYLKKAMEQRHIYKKFVETRILSSVAAYDNWIECRILSELEAIKQMRLL